MNILLSANPVLAAEMTRLFDLDLQLLADAVLMMIAVFALFLILSYLLFNPARKMITGRQEKIKHELETAAKDKDDAYALKETYEIKIRDIDKEADEILSAARKTALGNEQKIIAQAKEEAARIIERAGVEAELEKKKAVDDIKKEMISLASIMAGKVVAASIDTTVQNSLVDETLKEIGEGTWLS